MQAPLHAVAQPVTADQVYRLVRAFHEIADPDIREAVIRAVESIPRRQ